MSTSTYNMPKRPAPPSRPASIHSDDLSHGPSHGNDGDRPRKRVRKGTKSCWECKRRKVKCQLSSEDVPVCSGCLSRGTTCVSQEYPEERDSSGGLQVGERLGRVERLLETLVSKISAYEEEENAHKILTPESIGNDVLGSETTVDIVPVAEASPYIGLFSNTVIGYSVAHPTPVTTPGGRTPYASSVRTTNACGRLSKTERLCQTLLDLLPSDADLEVVFNTNYCAVLLSAMMTWISKEDLQSSKQMERLPPMDRSRPVSIARRLMYIAVCLQQLDPDFDHSKLNILPSPRARLERILSVVSTLVLADDELVTSVEGIECLVLQGMYSINDGTPRRAWLTFRRALGLAQLMGLKRQSSASGINGRRLWLQLIQGDRYLSLLLGLPAGSDYDEYEPDENFQNPNVNKDQLFGRKLSDISLRIIQRNQRDATPAYTGTQEIDDMLDSLSKELPHTWWQVPAHIPDDMSYETTAQFDKLMAQIWFFQIQALVHLPFMLRASTERRYEYSKFSCLKACREVMWRYLALRKSYNKSFCCKTIDFGALTATVALFLGLLNTTNSPVVQSHQDDADRALIKMVYEVMENFAKNKNEIVAAQSVTVIKSLLAVEHPTNQHEGNLRLTIPYFGTVSIVRPQPKVQQQLHTPPSQSTDLAQQQSQASFYTTTPQQESVDVSNTSLETQPWQNLQMPAQGALNYPTVSFQSTYYNEIAPAPTNVQATGWSEADTLFFDSLLNADLDGNWTF